MKARILAIFGALALALAIGFGVGGGEAAHAQGEEQVCDGSNYCLNAWNNGPDVNAYTGGVLNDEFYVYNPGTGYVNIQFAGADGGNYVSDCVGDLGNSSTDARAGLYSNCTGSDAQVAWGANFTEHSCTVAGESGEAFKNVHWGGWLAPASESDGAAFYLNSGNEDCFPQYSLG